MHKISAQQTVSLIARKMTVGYFPTPLSELPTTIEIVKHPKQYINKLMVEIKGNVHGNSAVTKQTCSAVTSTYMQCSSCNKQIDVRINLEGLKWRRAANLKHPADYIYVFNGEGNLADNIVTVKKSSLNTKDSGSTLISTFPNVVLGGTFDRLHVGHKILLTEAVFRCRNKLTVGVTDISMIKSKKLWELIEPVETRIANLRDFLEDVDGSLVYDIVPISDMFGPTQWDPDLDMLVVSAETAKGGDKVNEVRKERGLRQLAIHTVALVDDSDAGEADEAKVSSSNTRLRLLGTKLRPPATNPELPSRPYLIGLTGGIASGKSSIGKNLAGRGAGLVDCDKVAHGLYRPGTETYKALINMFGPGVVAANGEIDRKTLGSIVFKSMCMMEKLNKLLWPEILKASLEEANRLYKEEGKQVVVLEAAVLLRAGWDRSVHEVWTCIIPPAEAIARVVKRNGLSESDARARLDSQPSNSEQVAIANVVFCSLYSYEYTNSQVERAWTDLLQTVASTKTSNKL